ncbi:MAG: hypothetical protein GSR85_02610 [Desulfurococcales archaeon]|nr:hypothetical protein [Desulfurococcales archaeon]
MAKPEKVVKAKSWDELPEILEPGEYHVGDIKIIVRESVEKDEVVMFTRGVKKLADRYYG